MEGRATRARAGGKKEWGARHAPRTFLAPHSSCLPPASHSSALHAFATAALFACRAELSEPRHRTHSGLACPHRSQVSCCDDNLRAMRTESLAGTASATSRPKGPPTLRYARHRRRQGRHPPAYLLGDLDQFATLRPLTRLNSSSLFVTRMAPCSLAWAAIIKSMAPIGTPAFSSIHRTSP